MTQIFMREMEGGVQAKCEKGGGCLDTVYKGPK